MRGSELRILSSWTFPAAMGAMPVVSDTWDEAAFSDVAHETVREAVSRAALDRDDGFVWHTDVPCGPAATVLIEASDDAELVVVGSRGRGGFTGLVLGSVSQQVAMHSRCPAVIVH